MVEQGAVTTGATARRGPSLGTFIRVMAVSALILAGVFLPIQDWLKAGLEWIQSLGWAGYAIFIVMYALCAVLLMPGSVLTLGAGAVFGLGGGFLAVSVASTLGAAAAFLVGRFLARASIERRIGDNPKFAAIDRAVGMQGFKIVLLTRLSPVFPYNFLNYAYGLTGVAFPQYVLASWLGMMPGTLLYVYLGSAAGAVASAATSSDGAPSGDMWGLALKLLGLAATFTVTMVITRTARTALAQATESDVLEAAANAKP